MLENGKIRIIDHDDLEKLLQNQGGTKSIGLDSDSCEQAIEIISSEDNVQGNEENADEIDMNEADDAAEDNNDGREEEEPDHSAGCCDRCKREKERFEHKMLSKMNQVLELVRGVMHHRAVDGGGNVRRTYPLLPPMPFDDLQVLEQFDRDLGEEEFLKQFKNKIEDIGGKMLQKAIKFAMEAIMTDELTKRVVWSQGAEAIPKISKFRFPSVISDVMRDAFEGTKKKEVENRIAEWLRRGGDRLKVAAPAAAKKRRLQGPE